MFTYATPLFFCTQKLIIMEYLVFPFGKYRGTKLEELPSTYIVLALEKFELPDELKHKLMFIMHARLGVHDLILSAGKKSHDDEPDLEKSIDELHEYAYTIVDFLSVSRKK